MNLRERSRESDDQLRGQESGTGVPHESQLVALRAAADRFAAASRDAVENALSGNAEAFLRENRQRSGE